ncbi:LysR family transcriptional regulator [Lentzea albidocapillata]|uniref:DNA-binding transcriptional regulator, LysR family n=1 Tax=Lentzea albidocapillata TaxID=40571 RepID=A0A1W2DGZ3_9PSEU|nr:LysR family transcriptional regulator [Lentzea albidocapillata]SMC96717.1 DNA-binding transcriptional regulator, LysR family [Lentzea albidocapillata]
MELDVHHLKLVRAIGETGSLSEAAVRLGISQPAVSGSLKRLENALGQRLFDRGSSTASVMPTPTGELLLDRISAVLPMMEGLARDIEVRTSPSEFVRVGGVCSPVLCHLPAIVDSHRPHGPAASLFDSECRDLVVEMVVQRRLEVGVVKDYPGFEAVAPASVDFAVVAHDRTLVLLREDHPLARHKVIGLEQLADEPWVLPPPDSSRFHEYFHRSCRRKGFTPRVQYVSESFGMTVAAVRNGAVGLSQAACEGHQQVAARLLADDALSRRFLLVWHRESEFARVARDVLVDAALAYRIECEASPVYSRYLA